MARTSIGNTNVGLGSPLTTLIGYAPYPPNAAQMNWIRTQTYPTQGSPANVSTYAVAAGRYLFKVVIRSNDGAKGYVGFTYPYTFDTNGSGTFSIGSTTQAHDYYYSYITIRAYATYPYTFQYWQVDGGGIYSYTNPLNINVGDGPSTGTYTLIGVFA